MSAAPFWDARTVLRGREAPQDLMDSFPLLRFRESGDRNMENEFGLGKAVK